MPHTLGLKRATRNIFSKPYKTKGHDPLSRYLTNYKIGDYVTIKVDGSKHRGTPHRIYHGKTGRIYNITPHAAGVIIHKTVRNKVLAKKLNIRVEHLEKSKCKDAFIKRVKANDQIKAKGNMEGRHISTKRQP